MEDAAIVEGYWQRDENAIAQTREKYQGYLFTIASQILGDPRDSEEAVNDAYLKAWQAIPPHRPERLGAFLAKLTREAAIDCWRSLRRKKRSSTQYALSLEELGECVGEENGPGQAVEEEQLCQAIETYLKRQTLENRTAFVERYYYLDPVKVIAARRGVGEGAMKSLLFRLRRGLRLFLEKEGF